MNRIIIRDLAVAYRVGVPESERAKPQRLLISVEMSYSFVKAAQTDDLAYTIDYGAVARRLAAFGTGKSWKLLETLVVSIAEMIVTEFPAESVRVEVKKFIVPKTKYVSVLYERQATPHRRKTATKTS